MCSCTTCHIGEGCLVEINVDEERCDVDDESQLH